MQLLPNITTSTEVQRNFKKVAKRAKSIDDALIIFANNKPDLIIADYRWYAHIVGQGMTKKRNKSGIDAIFGTWSKKEANEFNKYIDEAFEQINPEDWK
ncbi:hypothetical protein ISR94_00345 [Candidatus Microgenomates bacterium]|nr:hypothetical protein [Candidatus Microgenomates bacterium]